MHSNQTANTPRILDAAVITQTAESKHLLSDLADILGNMRIELADLGAHAVVAGIHTGYGFEGVDVTFKCSVSLRYTDTTVLRATCPVLALTFPKFSGVYPANAAAASSTGVVDVVLRGRADLSALLASAMSRADVTHYIADAVRVNESAA